MANALCFIASLRAEFNAAVKVFVVEVNAEFRRNSTKFGAAHAINTAATAIVTISSIRVKPRKECAALRISRPAKLGIRYFFCTSTVFYARTCQSQIASSRICLHGRSYYSDTNVNRQSALALFRRQVVRRSADISRNSNKRHACCTNCKSPIRIVLRHETLLLLHKFR